MHFESLANELILEIFQYLNIFDLLHGFSRLNHRFTSLLFHPSHLYHLDFRSISKPCFDTFLKRNLFSTLIQRVGSLHLSNDDRTPHLPQTFLSIGLSLSHFVHLQSLTLYHLQSFPLFYQLLSQCSSLPSLRSLHLIQCYFKYSPQQLYSLLNLIWHYPHLVHCTFDQLTSKQLPLTHISSISSSIRSLIFRRTIINLDDLQHLLIVSPHLQSLAIYDLYISDDDPPHHFIQPYHSLTSLNLSYHGSLTKWIDLCQCFPSLHTLSFRTTKFVADGSHWENLLRYSFPHLTKFHLKMKLSFPFSFCIDDDIDEFIQTFCTSFWLTEHQWFIRCDWDPSNIFNEALLYTLPYGFDDCFYFDSIRSKSTSPISHHHFWSYRRVQHLSHEYPENDLAKDSILFSARFPHLTRLTLCFGFDQQFWSCLSSSFDHLTSLHLIWLDSDVSFHQCQQLFQCASRLYSLTLVNSKNISMKFFSICRSSVRQLDLINDLQSEIEYFDSQQCQLLLRSPLILRCEVLSIGIKHRTSLLDLIKKIPNLRSLICRCEDDDDGNQWGLSARDSDEFVQWLKRELSAVHSIKRDERRTNLIRFWLGDKSSSDEKQRQTILDG